MFTQRERVSQELTQNKELPLFKPDQLYGVIPSTVYDIPSFSDERDLDVYLYQLYRKLVRASKDLLYFVYKGYAFSLKQDGFHVTADSHLQQKISGEKSINDEHQRLANLLNSYAGDLLVRENTFDVTGIETVANLQYSARRIFTSLRKRS